MLLCLQADDHKRVLIVPCVEPNDVVTSTFVMLDPVELVIHHAMLRPCVMTLCLIRLDDTTTFHLPHVGPRCPKNLHNKNGAEVLALFVSAFFNQLLAPRFLDLPLIHRGPRA